VRKGFDAFKIIYGEEFNFADKSLVINYLAPTVMAVRSLVRSARFSSLVPELVVVSLAKPDV